MNPETYGDRMAGVYDSWYDDSSDTEMAVNFLSSRAGQGRLLELGVGTGRLALRLARLGYQVTGVDISKAMLDQLRSKDPDGLVHIEQRDMTNLDDLGSFSLIFAAFNGIFGLQSAAEQAQLFQSCATALDPRGLLVIEAHVPSAKGLATSGSLPLVSMNESSVRLEVMQLRESEQFLEIQLIDVREDGIKFYPSSLRYAYRSEMELMASAAGLTLVEALASWSGGQVGPEDNPELMVYQRPA